VAYLPLGRDATVVWNQFDMKFRNNTAHPVYLDYRAPGNRCVATLYGHRRPGWTVSIDTQVEHLAERHITADLYRTITAPGGSPKRTHLGSPSTSAGRRARARTDHARLTAAQTWQRMYRRDAETQRNDHRDRLWLSRPKRSLRLRASAVSPPLGSAP